MKQPQPQTKTDAAYREIRVAIESGELRSGDRLITNELQTMLGMSPTPIREALRLLQRDGLVQHMPHHGTVVAGLDEAMIAESRRVREVLEPLAAELAAERASDQELEQISSLHDRFSRAVEKDPAGMDVPGLNRDWHMAVYRASHSETLIEFIERLWVAMGATRYFSVHGPQSVAEHDAVMVALKARDVKKTGKLMRQHLTSVKQDIAERAPSPNGRRAPKRG